MGFSKKASKAPQPSNNIQEEPTRPVARAMKRVFNPTEEQLQAKDIFMSKQTGVVKIAAGAGTGKSSTLYYLGGLDERPSLGLVFGKDMAEEARAKSPSHIEWKSTHSLAYKYFGVKFQHKLKRTTGRYVNVAGTGAEIARYFNIPNFDITASKFISKAFIGLIIKDTVNRFETSADDYLKYDHIPYHHITVVKKRFKDLFDEKKFKNLILRRAGTLWEERQDVYSDVLITHNTYLKLYQLSNPDLSEKYDIIYVDESQDLNPVTLALVMAQEEKCKIVLVGDHFQSIYCQPKGTLVTKVIPKGVNGKDSEQCQVPIESLVEGDSVLSYSIEKRHLYKSGKPITKIGSKMYEGTLVDVEVRNNKTTYTKDHLCLVRANPDYKDHYVVYLMEKDGKFRIGSCKFAYGTVDGFETGTSGLVSRSSVEGADNSWILEVHSSQELARLREYTLSADHGIPQVCFKDPMGVSDNKVSALVYDQYWGSIDSGVNYLRGLQLIGKFQLDRNNPVWSKKSGRRWTKRGNKKLRQVFEISAGNLFEGLMMVEDNGQLETKGFKNTDWVEISVDKYEGSCEVFSMEVEGTHNYFGDNILTHNCFNGAVNAMKTIKGVQAKLTKSFRFGKAVASVANAVLQNELVLSGNEAIDSNVGKQGDIIDVDKPYTILFRGNMELIFTAVRYITEGKDVQVYVDLREFVAMVSSAKELKSGNLKDVKAERIIPFSDWEELVEEAKSDPELSRLEKIVENGEADNIVRSLKNHKNNPKAHITMLTAHKSKGLEWDQVILAEDFKSNYNHKGEWVGLSEQERNLTYVAATRAVLNLQYNRVVEEFIDLAKTNKTVKTGNVKVKKFNGHQFVEETGNELIDAVTTCRDEEYLQDMKRLEGFDGMNPNTLDSELNQCLDVLKKWS